MSKLPYRRFWKVNARDVTPEEVFRERRRFLQAAGSIGLGFAGLAVSGCGPARDAARIGAQENPPAPELYPAPRNSHFRLDRPVTDQAYAASYNNFYEFSVFKGGIYKKTVGWRTSPWQVEIGGLVEKPRVFDIAELVRAMSVEERLYRFRCVEAWAMAVPWTGFPLRDLIKAVQPLSAAKYVRLTSFLNPQAASNQNPSRGPWPYTEGLTMAEAMNELTLLATGIYGRALPKQHGAPLRLVVPWKYGFKSVKSIVHIDFTAAQPQTFWNSNRPQEYDFTANVDPAVPHPRWSQASEKLIDTGERRATLPLNGYGEWVAGLYNGSR